MNNTQSQIITTEPNKTLSVNEVKSQISTIQHLLKEVMKEGEHYGLIPGCGDKMVLLKSGAEKINMMFRLAPRITKTVDKLENGHREYDVVCALHGIENGKFYGEGVGSCSTMENKYRYRWDNTGKEVPTEYWTNRDQDLIGGNTFTTRKKGAKWYIFQRIEHDNPADYYNTCLKMAKKRAQVDATLTVTAASDLFTSDIDETEPDDSIIEEDRKTKHETTVAGKTMAPNNDGTFKEKERKEVIQSILNSTENIKDKLNIIADYYSELNGMSKEAVLTHFSSFEGEKGWVTGKGEIEKFTDKGAFTAYGKIKKELSLE